MKTIRENRLISQASVLVNRVERGGSFATPNSSKLNGAEGSNSTGTWLTRVSC